MAGSDGKRGRRGAVLLEALVALVLVGVAGAAVLALLLHSLRLHHRAELLGRAAPAVVEFLHHPPADSTGVRPVGNAVLRWDLEDGLELRLEIPRGTDAAEVVGRWRIPTWEGDP